jgi:hypothetical protein
MNLPHDNSTTSNHANQYIYIPTEIQNSTTAKQIKSKQVKRNRNKKGQGAHTHKLERKCMISTTTQIKNT